MIAGLLLGLSLSVCYVPPVAAEISRPYEAPDCRYCAGHRGVEYSVAPGTQVHTVAAGVVSFVGVVAGTRYVVVLQSDGLRATYGMLATSSLSRGDVAVEGATVGVSGAVLYFGLRGADDDPVDPTPLLGHLVGRPRLVPREGAGRRTASPPRVSCAATVSGISPA
jgi:murein DD-endopeptidase MepM/ murein hydrolase activator NlpD